MPEKRRRGFRTATTVGALIVVAGVIAVSANLVAATNAPTFSKAQAIANCSSPANDPGIFQGRPAGVDVVGNAAAVAYVSGDKVALCGTGIGSTGLSFVETTSSRGPELQVMFLTNDDWNDYWSLIHTGSAVARIQVATAWGPARSRYLGHGAWLVNAPFRVPASIVNPTPANGSLWAGQVLGFSKAGLLVASVPMRFCVHQDFTNLNHCQVIGSTRP